MESLLDCGRSLLAFSGNSKADFSGNSKTAVYSGCDKIEMECAAAFDDDDDTASLSGSSGVNCFDAFLDSLQVISLQETAANEDDGIIVPWLGPTITCRRSNNSSESDRAPPSVQPPSDLISEKDQSTPLENTSTEDAAIITLPAAVANRGSNIFDSETEYSSVETLPEYPRQHHNDRGQRDRRQRRKMKGVQIECLRELQDRRHQNDRGQRDHSNHVWFGKHAVNVSNDEVSIVNNLIAKALCTEALRFKAFNDDTLATKDVHDNALIQAQGQLERKQHLSDFLGGTNVRNKLVNKMAT